MPPFILREAGLEVNDTPKIQGKDPTIHDQSIYFPSSDVRITLSFNGILSYFPCRTPTIIELYKSDVLTMTPDGHSWDPHCCKDMYEVPTVFSGVASVLSSISPVIDPVLLSNALEERGTIRIFASAIGSMNTHIEKYLFNLSPYSSDEPKRG